MADPGVARNKKRAKGQEDYQTLKASGMPDDELQAWVTETNNTLAAAQVPPSEIDKYWGAGTPNDPRLAALVRDGAAEAADDPRTVKDPGTAFAAGLKMSSSVLPFIYASGGRKPGEFLAQDASVATKFAYQAGQMVGDIPAGIVGFIGGGAAGAAAGTAVAPGPGTVVGGLVGAGAGSAAAPEAIRQGILSAYKFQEGNIDTWQDAAGVIGEATLNVGKAGTVGAITAPIGGAASAGLVGAGVRPYIATGADAVTQSVVGAGLYGAMEGHMPDGEDFILAATSAAGFHAAHGGAVLATRAAKTTFQRRVQSNVEQVYVEQGVPPWTAADAAQKDPDILDELIGQDVEGRANPTKLRDQAPREPEPYEPPPLKATSSTGAVTAEVVRPARSVRATSPAEASELLRQLEGSEGHAKHYGIPIELVVSPAGAIGEYQIMPGTARQYMGKNFDVRLLFDRATNKLVHDKIVADLYKRYNGDMTAIAIAYNAGPGRATQWLAKGPGKRLVATPDKSVRTGIRYEYEPAARDESFLPTETQKYLANGRRRMGRELSDEGAAEPFVPQVKDVPDEVAAALKEGDDVDAAVAKHWEQADEGTLVKEMLTNIGEEPKIPMGSALDRALSEWESDLVPARRIDDRLVKAKLLDRDTEVGIEDMARNNAASDARLSWQIRHGALEIAPDGRTVRPVKDSPSLVDVGKEVHKAGSEDDFKAYLVARRTVELENAGKKSGIKNVQAARALLAKASIRRYDRAKDLFQQWKNGFLRYSETSGVHSREAVERLENWADHVSFRRIMGDHKSFTGGRGLKVRDSLRRYEGSNRQIVDPILAAIDNARLIVKMADRNRTIGHIVAKAEAGKIAGFRRVEDLDVDALAKEAAADLKPYGIKDTPENRSALAPLLAERAAGKIGKNEFVYFRDGKAERWITDDPDLAILLKGAETPEMADIVTNVFHGVAQVQRKGVTGAVDFPLRIFAIDQWQAFILSPLHPPPYIQSLKGMFRVLTKHPIVDEAIANGALASMLRELDVNYVKKDAENIFDETKTWAKVVNTVFNPLELATMVNELLDTSNRVGLYELGKKKGLEPIKAATMSREAYLDFAERGTGIVTNWLAKTVPFYRAGMLGNKQIRQAFVRRPAETAAYSFVAVSLASVALYFLNYAYDQTLDEDSPERYSEIPQWQRDTHFITPPIMGKRVRLHMPFGIGFVFGGLSNRLLDHFLRKDPKAFDDMAQSFLRDFVTPFAPPAAKIPIEIASNHSFFSGRTLTPASVEGADNYMEYTPATSETGKALARALGKPGLNIVDMSPIVFDYTIKQSLGSLGSAALDILDIPYRDVKRPWELENSPFAKSFFVRNPGMSAASIQAFYDEAGEASKALKSFQFAAGRAAGGAETSEIDETVEGSVAGDVVQPFKEQLSLNAQLIQGINADATLTDAEKLQQTDQLVMDMIGVAKQGSAVLRDLKGAGEAPAAGAIDVPPPPSAPASGPPAVPVPANNAGVMAIN